MMQRAFEGDVLTLFGQGRVALLEHAYELAIFQICDDGGIYTELTADEVQEILRRELSAEWIRTGSDDPEALKATALAGVYHAAKLAHERQHVGSMADYLNEQGGRDRLEGAS